MVGTGRSKWPVIYREDGEPFFGNGYEFTYGTMDLVRPGKDGAIVTYGGMLYRAIDIRERLMKEGVTLCVVNMACVSDVDGRMLDELHKLPFIFTYEDHHRDTGIAPLLATRLLEKGYRGRMVSFGVKDYGASGDTEEIMQLEGLDASSMAERLLAIMKE